MFLPPAASPTEISSPAVSELAPAALMLIEIANSMFLPESTKIVSMSVEKGSCAVVVVVATSRRLFYDSCSPLFMILVLLVILLCPIHWLFV